LLYSGQDELLLYCLNWQHGDDRHSPTADIRSQKVSYYECPASDLNGALLENDLWLWPNDNLENSSSVRPVVNHMEYQVEVPLVARSCLSIRVVAYPKAVIEVLYSEIYSAHPQAAVRQLAIDTKESLKV
jgi:hypothetical protein